MAQQEERTLQDQFAAFYSRGMLAVVGGREELYGSVLSN